MKPDRIWSFDDLQKEVVDNNLCGKCGGCVSFCSANRIGALKVEKNGFPAYDDREKCLECGMCYMVCPQTHPMSDEVDEAYNWKPPIGHYMDVFSARSSDIEIRKVATDGGVVTSLLIHMLKNGIIDGAVVSLSKGLFNREAKVATTRNELIQAAGSHFAEVPHLEEVGKGYSTFVPVIRPINELAPKRIRKIAVVGTPCQIGAIRKMQALKLVPSDIVTFTIGLFCMQCFETDQLLDRGFIKQYGITTDDIAKINIKEDLVLTMKSGITVHIPLEEIEEIARPACLACRLFSNSYADISVGGLGSPDGYTTVMVRTIKGKEMIANALYQGGIERRSRKSVEDGVADRRRIITLVEEFTDKKITRSKKYWDEYRSQAEF